MRDLGREILSQSLAQVLPTAPDATPLLRVTGLSFRVNEDLSIGVPELNVSGSGLTMILGPNGAGKSLLIRMLHGLVSPDQGTTLFNGQKVDAKRCNGQAMVFQKPVLLRRSVTANLRFALRGQGLTKPERAAKISHLVELAGLTGKERRPARSLSGGEEQCLALACALARSPRLLFLDEPTSSLDPTATHRIETILRQVSLMGVKVVMVSHDMGQAARLADDIIFVNRGKICEECETDEFFDGPRSAEAQAFLSGRLLL